MDETAFILRKYRKAQSGKIREVLPEELFLMKLSFPGIWSWILPIPYTYMRREIEHEIW